MLYNTNVEKPKILNEGEYDQKDLDRLRSNEIWKEVDVYDDQLKELFEIENPSLDNKSPEYSRELDKFLHSRNKTELSGSWVYYPWNGHLLHIVNAEDYFILKTNRNKDLITKEEQKKLYNLKVAVLGMSVGSNIAFVLTQAGISRDITITDFDTLDTTNLNRIWAGIHQVGLQKTTIAARRIYEDNPYANVYIYPKGMDKETLEKLLQDKKIDCIVEEIDDMQMKINTRILAKKYKVPVLMITDNGDYGVLHVERYDTGYNKIFNQDEPYWIERMQSYSGKKDFADIVINDIVGGPEKVDPRMLSSAKRVVSRELVSWPQLGSAALLGGIAVAFVIKQIIRGEFKGNYLRAAIKPL